MLTKLSLIFLAPVVSLLLATQVGSAILSEKMTTCYPSEFLENEKRLYRAWIVIEYKDYYLKIRAFCFNDTSENQVLRYKLQAKRDGKSGTVNISQGGYVSIASQEKKCLSQLGLSASPKDWRYMTFKDHYQITLEVYKDGKLVGEDSVFFPRILKVHTLSGISSLFSLLKPRHAGERAGPLLSPSCIKADY